METRNCQNCKKGFEITSDDFSYYQKIKVPPPTFCPECRFIRRIAWRNERVLHRRTCDLCTKNIVSIFRADAVFPVYCRDCWYSDKWDATTYGREYDFSKPFFQQLKELYSVVPHLALWQRNVVNSDYAHLIGECKNVYLSVSVVLGSENVFYSKGVDKSSNIYDCYNVKESDGCYEVTDGEKNYNVQHLMLSRNCINSSFLIDCVNCSNCILSSNLRNKEFYVRNKQYSKEEYFKILEELNLGSRKSRQKVLAEFYDLCWQSIHRFATVIKSPDSTGNNIVNVKSGIQCFDFYNSENCKFGYRAFGLKDCMDTSYAINSELLYEYTTGALNAYNVKFSYSAMDAIRNADYIDSCTSSTNLFGAMSVRSKENVILNKVYSKEAYAELREKIIKHMNEMPFIGSAGIVYKYGEFFPFDLSAFGYNESPAQDFAPVTREEALKRGYRWEEPEEKNFSITMQGEEIPDNIADVADPIMSEVIGCSHARNCNHQCQVAFKITPDELQYYKKNSIPLPDKCPNCRHYERFALVLPPKLWPRFCMCTEAGHDHQGDCQNTFETSYSPDRPEKVYCESCYQKSVL